jgi:hypothetical protein
VPVFRVKTLPATLEPKSWYLVRPDDAEAVQLFVTGLDAAEAVPVGDPTPDSPGEVMDPGDLTLYFQNGLT